MSSSKLRALVAALFVFAFASPATAADWYGEVHAGKSHSESSGIPTLAFDRDSSAYGLGVGVAFNEYFSTQLDWHELGANQDFPVLPPCYPVCSIIVTYPVPEQGWTLRAIPRLPLGESFALELGIGWMKWEGDYNAYGTPVSDTGTDPFYSFGVVWKFGERWSATVEYQQLEHDFLDFDYAGASLRYKF